MIDSFSCVYDDTGECTHLLCKKCGQRVERGIVNVAEHFNNCPESDPHNLKILVTNVMSKRIGRIVLIPICDIGVSEEQRDALREMFVKPDSYNFIKTKGFKPLKVYWPVKPPKF